MNLQRIPLERICIFKISTMYVSILDKHSGPTLHYPAFKVVFLYFKKRCKTSQIGKLRSENIHRKNPMAEREPGSPPLPHGEPPGLQIFGIFVAFFSNGGSGGNSKIFYFHPENWGKWSNLTSIFFELGWNHQKLKWFPSRSFFLVCPWKVTESQ